MDWIERAIPDSDGPQGDQLVGEAGERQAGDSGDRPGRVLDGSPQLRHYGATVPGARSSLGGSKR
jgi:hypothetical protein